MIDRGWTWGGPVLLAAILLGSAPELALAQSSTRPAIGAFGFDEQGMDASIPAGLDFYRYANGAWARTTPIPPEKSNIGAFTQLDDLNRQRVKAILDEARADPASKAGAAYAAFLDEAAVEAKGLVPARPWLDRISAIGSRADYARMIGLAAREGVAGPFELAVAQDDHDPEAYILKLAQAGLGLPDREYYLRPQPAMANARAAYRDHLARLLVLSGVVASQAVPRADALMALETEIAKVSWSRVDSRDAGKTYNRRTRAQVRAQAAGFDFGIFLTSAGAKTDRLVLMQPDAIAGIARLLGAAPLGVLKDALRVAVLDAYGDVLPRAFADERFTFHGRLLSGLEAPEPRWRRAVAFAVDAVPDEVGRVYVARHFPAGHKAAGATLQEGAAGITGHWEVPLLPGLSRTTGQD